MSQIVAKCRTQKKNLTIRRRVVRPLDFGPGSAETE
jgi:hypothetical protein